MRSSLARYLPDSATPPEQLEAMRRCAYREHGVILVKPSDDLGEWLSAALDAWATRTWGKRTGERG